MRKWVNIVNFSNQKPFSNSCLLDACMISERTAKHLDVTTVFTYSHKNRPLGQSERAYYLSQRITKLLQFRTLHPFNCCLYNRKKSQNQNVFRRFYSHKMHLLAIWVFLQPKRQLSLPFHILQPVKSLQGGAPPLSPRIGRYREYPSGQIMSLLKTHKN